MLRERRFAFSQAYLDVNVITKIKLQKKAALIILDADPLSASKEMFEKFNWLPSK